MLVTVTIKTDKNSLIRFRIINKVLYNSMITYNCKKKEKNMINNVLKKIYNSVIILTYCFLHSSQNNRRL